MAQTTTYRQQSQTAPGRGGRHEYLFTQAKETGRPIADTDMALTPLANTWPGNTAGVGVFDGIYKDANGKIYFIEAKGGNSTLGSRKIQFSDDPVLLNQRAQQGTKEYMDDIIANMNEKIKTIPDGTEKELLEETMDFITRARRDENIDYIMIRQKFTSTGEIGNIEIEKFNIWNE